MQQPPPGAVPPPVAPLAPASKYEEDWVLTEPFNYLLRIPGKELRSKLIDAFNWWLKVPTEQIDHIKRLVRMLHVSSLMIDDIEDNSKLRRGIPVVHAIYGVPTTINSANYMYFIALQQCTALNNERATNCFLEEMVRLHWGQGFDIYWRDSATVPTEADYRKMVLDKTGGLFRLATGLMQAFSESRVELTGLVNNIAEYFQIRDDYMNLQASDALHKSYCEDLTEGKFSFPIIHSIAANPRDHRLLNILRQHTGDDDIKRYAVEYMRQTGSFEYTRKAMDALMADIMKEIAAFGGNPELEEIMLYLQKTVDGEPASALGVPGAPGAPGSRPAATSGLSPLAMGSFISDTASLLSTSPPFAPAPRAHTQQPRRPPMPQPQPPKQ